MLGFQNELKTFAKNKIKASFIRNQKETLVTEQSIEEVKNEVSDLKCIAVALRKNKKSVDQTGISRMQSSVLMDTTSRINLVNQQEGLTARDVVEKKLVDKRTLKNLIEKQAQMKNNFAEGVKAKL